MGSGSFVFAILLAVALAPASPIPAFMQEGPSHGQWGLQPDGDYINPILPGDFSDLDAIRVGKDFYAISSTFQYSPGIVILRSRDLVNWEIIGHVVKDVSSIGPEMKWDRMSRAGRGIWAGSIRYRRGKFYVYFGTPDEGIFMTSAVEVTGEWAPLKRVIAQPGWDDPCPFWDDDGQGYLVATRFAEEAGKQYNVHLFRLNDAGDALQPGFDAIIHQSPGSEANKLDRIHGMYFHYYSEVKPEGRVPMMERAPSLTGPWEAHQLMHVNKLLDKEPNQGGLVELADGRWYFVSHQGTGDWEGRAGVLLPVHWIEGWPIPGRPGPDGIGNMEWRAKAPLPASVEASPGLVASDDFTTSQLKPQWEWNYQPRPEAWSLSEKPGVLRMRAFPPLRTGDFSSVGNVLTQRAMRTAANVVTVKITLNKMADGQRAGLAHYAGTDAEIEVEQQQGIRRLAFVSGGAELPGPRLTASAIWLRSRWGFDGLSRFSYSDDGVTFIDFGPPYPLTWGHYRGDRVGIFTFNPQGTKGITDVLSFRYAIAH